MEIGPKVDLYKDEKGWRFADYYDRFTKQLGREARVLEWHLLWNNIINPEELEKSLNYIAGFLSKHEVEVASFHYPDEKIPSEISWLNETLAQIGRTRIRDEKVVSVQEAEERFYQTIEILGKSGIRKPILVTHKGGVQLENEFFRNKKELELRRLRKEYLINLEKEHRKILECCGDKIILGLENTAPVAWDDNEGYLCEQAFEHFQERLKLGGVYVLDTAHAAMSCEHGNKQNKFRLTSMKSIEFNNPASLESLIKHIRIAGNNIGLIHLADARGVRFEDEGLTLGIRGGIIDWFQVVSAINYHVRNPHAVLEIKGAHLDYDSTIGASLKYLQDRRLV